MIRGFFRNGAGFMNVHLISESMDIDETVEFMVGRHPLEKMTQEELIRTLRIPSLLGRDVINRFRLIFDKEKEELTLG